MIRYARLAPRPIRLFTDDQGRRTVMLVASLQVAASKCCHAAAMPAGGQEPAGGRDKDPDQAQSLLPAPRIRAAVAADRPANPDRPWSRGFRRTGCDTLRLAHRRDEERTDTWNTSGMYRFFLLENPYGTRKEERDEEEKEIKKEEIDGRECGVSNDSSPYAGCRIWVSWNGYMVKLGHEYGPL